MEGDGGEEKEIEEKAPKDISFGAFCPTHVGRALSVLLFYKKYTGSSHCKMGEEKYKSEIVLSSILKVL